MEIVNDNTVALYKCYGAGGPFFSFYKKGYARIKYLATIPQGCYFDTCQGYGGATLVYMPDGSPMISPYGNIPANDVFGIGAYDGKVYRFTNLRKVNS